MSTFTGKLLEYPFVSIDRFNGENLSSAVFFLSHCHKDHMEGLLDVQFFKRLRTGNSSVKLYTSETTKNLIQCDTELRHLLDFVVGIPIHQPRSVNIIVSREEKYNVVVTLLSAGHCVGSVMFLFEGEFGKVLYTGDFRILAKDINKVPTSFCNLKSVYVDTTFCCPLLPKFPTREDTTNAAISIIESWISKGPHYMVHLKCKGRYGYEYIMKEIAKYFHTKLHVNDWRMQMSAKLPYMLEHFTTVSKNSQIHVCYYGMESTSSVGALPCGLHFLDGRACKVLTLVPSSLYFIKKGQVPEKGKIWVPKQKIWRVFHSMHASYHEMRKLLKYLRPQNIYPFVPPVDCQDIVEAYNRLKDLQSKGNGGDSEDEDLNKTEKSVPIDVDPKKMKTLQKNSNRTMVISPLPREMAALFNPLASPPPARRQKRRHPKITDSTTSKKKDIETPFISLLRPLRNCEKMVPDLVDSTKSSLAETNNDIHVENLNELETGSEDLFEKKNVHLRQAINSLREKECSLDGDEESEDIYSKNTQNLMEDKKQSEATSFDVNEDKLPISFIPDQQISQHIKDGDICQSYIFSSPTEKTNKYNFVEKRLEGSSEETFEHKYKEDTSLLHIEKRSVKEKIYYKSTKSMNNSNTENTKTLESNSPKRTIIPQQVSANESDPSIDVNICIKKNIITQQQMPGTSQCHPFSQRDNSRIMKTIDVIDISSDDENRLSGPDEGDDDATLSLSGDDYLDEELDEELSQVF